MASSTSPRFELSSSVKTAIEKVGTGTPIRASDFARVMVDLHPEYGERKVKSVQLSETPRTAMAEQWVRDIQTLFDSSKIQAISASSSKMSSADGDHAAILHGRLLIVGLGLLEPTLRAQLDSVGAFTAIISELKEPLQEILTEHGRELFTSSAQNQHDLWDTVPNWPDDPLQESNEDLLGRRAFARFIAKRIAAVPTGSGAYSMHIYGPWGAGKSTLLNFLSHELAPKDKRNSQWHVVEFNAWRHQHIQPPWWSLMEQIFQATKGHLSFWQRLQEYWWRLTTGRLQYILAVIVMAWLVPLVIIPLLRQGAADGDGVLTLGDSAEDISKLLALMATIWGGIVAFNRSLLLGAAHAAQNYSELTHDPTSKIKERFNELIAKLRPARVVILIDDLDRCQSHYVVDLLEGIQTLFREAPVVFVIAADRNWLHACYEEAYEKLGPKVYEPGKPLGALFLEKAFRFSTPMPGIPEQLRESYWRYLLHLKRETDVKDLNAVRDAARDEVARIDSDSEVDRLIKGVGERSFAEQRALREEAVVRLASPEVLERIEHTLKRFAHLLEPNPRAMKLLVNSYSANRALAILSEVEIERDQLALWTILGSRWPQLADYLAEHPETLDNIGALGDRDIPEGLKGLFLDQSVLQVIKGASVDGAAGNGKPSLTKQTLELCARMRA